MDRSALVGAFDMVRILLAMWLLTPASAFALDDSEDGANSGPTVELLAPAALELFDKLHLQQFEQDSNPSAGEIAVDYSLMSFGAATAIAEQACYTASAVDCDVNQQCCLPGTGGLECQTCGTADGRASASTLGALMCMGLFFVWKVWRKQVAHD